jgi:hypothetical protein
LLLKVNPFGVRSKKPANFYACRLYIFIAQFLISQ